jgi:hypothetical protein
MRSHSTRVLFQLMQVASVTALSWFRMETLNRRLSPGLLFKVFPALPRARVILLIQFPSPRLEVELLMTMRDHGTFHTIIRRVTVP